MSDVCKSNTVKISGIAASNLELFQECYGERFFIFYIRSMRLSGKADVIPVVVPGWMSDGIGKIEGEWVSVSGQYRSQNQKTDSGNKLFLGVFAFDISFPECGSYENRIKLTGFVCKEPNFRETPTGRRITDLILAVNRPHKKSDYLPCIAWGNNAIMATCFCVGTKLNVEGRVQSREYIKKLEDGTVETRMAYEVSISEISVLSEGEER